MFFLLFDHHAYLFWLTFTLMLLVLELFGTSLYAFWSSLSAACIAVISYAFPIGASSQWFLFAILEIITIVVWWRWSMNRKKERHAAQLLNQPILMLVGQQCTLVEPIINNYGRAKIGDSSWRVYCDTELPVGAVVIIQTVRGNTLVVKPKV